MSLEMKKTFTVAIKFYYYDKNSKQKYCSEIIRKNFKISEELNRYFAVKENLRDFIKRNDLNNVITIKTSLKNHNYDSVKDEIKEIETEINNTKKETTDLLKKAGYSFINVNYPHEVLSNKKYEEKEEDKSI